MNKWTGHICSKIKKKLEKNFQFASNCFALVAGEGVYQVTHRENTYVVELKFDRCDCRRWQLTGIPCGHAIACFREERIKPEDKLEKIYSLETYMRAYGHNIKPVRDQSHWQKMNGVTVAPPYKKHVGRPRRCRRKEPKELEKRKLSKHGVVMHCSICHSSTHNKKGHNRAMGLPASAPEAEPEPNIGDDT